jgi:hypothetical protein
MSTDAPLKTQRLAALAFCSAWYIISGSIGLNALIKANQRETHFRKQAPAGVTLNFHINGSFSHPPISCPHLALHRAQISINLVLSLRPFALFQGSSQ